MLAHVLSAQTNVRLQNRFGNKTKRRKRRTNDNVDFLDCGKLALQVLGEIDSLGHRLVHFPIAGDDEFAFLVHESFSTYLSERAATPGSSWPSRNSRLAPPPVLMKVTRLP